MPQKCPFQSSFTHRTAQFTQGIPQFSQFSCRHHNGIISSHSIHSADEHRMIYSFSNTSYYSTFYAVFSSFRITLWPMWLANSKRSLVFIHHSHTHKKTHRTDRKKTWQTGWETCAVPENIQFSFSCSFFTQLNSTVWLWVYGALNATHRHNTWRCISV